jgi:hypothetical protein
LEDGFVEGLGSGEVIDVNFEPADGEALWCHGGDFVGITCGAQGVCVRFGRDRVTGLGNV